MKSYDFLVVGAGLYGSVMARKLTDSGYSVLVIDKRDRIGGNCASKDMNGIDVHLYGPHVFHTSDEKVWNYITKFGEFRQFTHKVLSNYRGNVYNFPLNKKTRQDFEKIERYTILSDEGFYNAFFKEYSEKQWNCDFANVPVKALNRIPVRDNYNDSYFDDYYTGIPVQGYNALFEKLLAGIEVRLNTDFSDIWTGDTDYDKIIYTGAIDSFYNYQHGRLGWRSLRFEFIECNFKDFQGIGVIHYPEKKYAYTRITEFKHFNPFNEAFNRDYTVYAEEYPCTDLENPYYPVENDENELIYLRYQRESFLEKNVHFGGRLGTYVYNDMDVTVKNALNDSEKIIKGELLK